MSHEYTQLSVTYHEKCLQFLQPAGTSRGVYYDRHLWYVEVRAQFRGRNVYGLGECAPLPQLSCDDVPNYEQILSAACQMWQESGQVPEKFLRDYPSILMGLQTALLSLRACAIKGSPFLLSDTSFSRGEVGIPINGLVWMGNAEEMLSRMEAKLQAGFRCIKIKIGAIDFAAEVELLRTLRQHYAPHEVELRLDANGAFSPTEVMDKLTQLAPFHIHSIEQPIRAGQWETMAEICKHSPIPIALDEELIGINDGAEKARLLNTIRPQYIILKPSLHGGFSGAEEWEDLADARGIGHWATSALESNVGLNAIAHWVAQRQHKKQGTAVLDMPQGLGTGQLFVENYPHVFLDIQRDELWYGSEKDRQFQHELQEFSQDWNNSAMTTITLRTSGSTGTPKQMEVCKSAMQASAERTISALDIPPHSTALLCLPLQYVAGKMMTVRAFVGDLILIMAAPSLHPYAHLCVAPQFAALTPLQAAASLEVPREKCLLETTDCIILGGGSVSKPLEEALQECQGKVYSTYGMTETLSHIALRRINGSEASDWYSPLKGVSIALNEEGCLIITDPLTNDAPLVTNDLAEINKSGEFRILGRRDNVVCSGGLKLHLEQIEAQLSAHDWGLMLTSVPHNSLGEALVCLYLPQDLGKLQEHCAQLLTKHERPRYFIEVSALPCTATGKPARSEARKFAEQQLFLQQEKPNMPS